MANVKNKMLSDIRYMSRAELLLIAGLIIAFGLACYLAGMYTSILEP